MGKVIEMGNAVRGLSIGARVGVGPTTGACFSCDDCKRGEPQFCRKLVSAYNGKDHTGRLTYGGQIRMPSSILAAHETVVRMSGFAERIRVDYRFCFQIPDVLSSEASAPLLCAVSLVPRILCSALTRLCLQGA